MKLFAALLLFVFSSIAFAQERIALVIGNSNYEISPLANTLNDAQDITTTLEELDFTVTIVIDADRKEMIKAIRAFGKSLDKETVALFYYAGHGVQYNGENYLIPVGAIPELTERSYLEDEAVTLSRVTRVISESGSKLNFVFLDACRDNPIPADSRGIQKGLIQTQSAVGSLIAFSTAPGRVAEDGAQEEGSNSPYTKNLLKLIVKPNVPVEKMLKDLKAAVSLATNERQSPWYESNIEGDFCFKVKGKGCGISIIIQNTIVGIPFLKGVDNIQLVEFENGSSYVGQVIGNNTPQGKGVMTLANGNQIEGEWHSGDISKGKIAISDGGTYEGEIQNKQMHGQGVQTHPDGRRYEGEFKDDLPNGQGIETYADGTRNEGEFRDGYLNGQGVQTHPDGRRYEGEFKDDLFNGQGIETYADGTRYEGEFKDGYLLSGQGVVLHSNGSRYEGGINDGLANGQGVMTLVDGTRYEGEWSDGVLNGQGVVTIPNGIRYEGEWSGGVLNGQAVMTYADGRRYKGEFEYSEPNGQGVYTWPDGRRYEGEWKDGDRNGQGFFTHPDGTRFVEAWKNGTLISSEEMKADEIN